MEPAAADGPDHAIDRAAARLRCVLGLATLTMLVLSWPLWIETAAFPRVPFVSRLPEVPALAAWVVFGLLLAAVAAATAGLARRATLGLSVGVLTFLILQDQHRFQPWAYQYLVIGLLLATLSKARALAYSRWWYAAVYLHSGLSKLDVSFCREMGALFLATAMRPLGLNPESWPPGWRTAAILAMPAWEIVVAVLLVVPATRRAGVAGALVLHAALLYILGPLGLGHSTIVLVWNAAMMAEITVAFGPDLAEATISDTRLGPWVRGAFWIAVVLPLGERSGLCDAWPAYALYASHVERTGVFLHEDDLGGWPGAIRRHLGPPGPEPWRWLDLTGWSREVRGVPVYPQGRACHGLAEALAARYGGRRLIRVIHWGRADRWSGRRTRVECLGPEAIRRQGDGYRLNAHPSGAFLAPTRAGGGPIAPRD